MALEAFLYSVTPWRVTGCSRAQASPVASPPGAWLEDAAPANWNTPGMDIPDAPPPDGTDDPRCTTQERGSESPEEDQVVAAGWHIYSVAWVGWNLRLVNGLSGYDGMCRPLAFQTFVFADAQFAGTISPTTMVSRTEGSGRIVSVRGPDRLAGNFVRYTSTDPLCCPSKTFTVDYDVDRGSPDGPLLVPLTSTPNPR
ncbi:MAG: LppP/LprE family lipoprotein [Chloroflexota bacterium]